MTKIVAGVDLDDLTNEITGETHSVNEADQVLKKYGISIIDEAGNMRELGVVLDEIGAKWQGMSKLEQNQLSYVIAGQNLGLST